MSFWGGVAKGFEAGEAKREREQTAKAKAAAAAKAKDWQQKMFDYRVKQDEAAASASANQLSFKNSLSVLDIMSTTAKNGSGAPKGAGKPKQSLEASINILKTNGASDEVLSSFAGHGALALSKAVDAWDVYQSEIKDRPLGTVRTIDDFLTAAVATTNPGVEPDMVEAARVMGISEEELDNPMYKGTGYTWRDAINKKLGKESSTSVYFGPTGTTPDVFDPAKAVKQANESVDGVLTAQISQNNVTLSSLEVGTDQYKAVSAENARISQAMEAMKEGRPAEAIRLVGANALLPMLSNTPGSLEYNLGGGWDQAIDNVTFTNTEEYANAFAKGAVGVGDWVVVDGSVLRIKEPPAVGPKVGKTEPVDLTGNTFTTAQMNSLTKEEWTALAESNQFITVDGKTILSPLYREEEAKSLVKTIETNFNTVGELLPTLTADNAGEVYSVGGREYKYEVTTTGASLVPFERPEDTTKSVLSTDRLDSKGEGFVMPEAAAEGVTTALLAGQKTREALSNLPGVTSPEYELTAAYINATDDMTSALNRGAANAADFIYGMVGGEEQTNIAEWLRSDADRIDAKADMTAEALVDGMNSWFGGLFSTDTKAEATENVAKVLTRGSDTPAAKALLETIQERVDYAAKRKVPPEVAEAVKSILERGDKEAIDQANEELSKEFGKDVAAELGLPSPAQNPMGFADSPRLSELLSNVPEEVQQAAASILTRGDQKDIDQANEELSKEFGQEAADALLRQKDTNRRIAEEDMAMARPVPQPLSDIVIPIKPSDPALDDTNRRIAEEDMAMAVPVPQSWGDLPIKSLPRPKDESDSELLARISELAAANDEEKAKLLGQKPFSDGLMASPRIKNTKAGQLLSEIIALATANDDEKAELLGQKPFSDNVMPKRKKKKLKKGVATERNQAEAVLQKHGFNILNFLRSEGFTSEDTEEDIAEGLADWYSNNSEDLSIKSPPMDVGPVTYVLKIMLDKGE